MKTMSRTVRMDMKRRPTLPLELLKAAGIKPGEDLLISLAPEHGALILRSRSGALRDIQDEIATGFEGRGRELPTTSLRADRAADDAALDQRIDSSSKDPQAAGAALLSRLGL
jgi:bifunctional DNA-binding transcriptional regulator/antitoxin component of YhaV-PrlF toxin-antitoxin module